MFRKLKSVRCEKGSVTIEATVSLTTFMFVIITLLSVINIMIAQAKMAYAIDATAKEISQYSYLYSLTGLMEREAELYSAGAKGTSDVKQVVSDVNDMFNEVQKLGTDAKSTVEQTPNDINDIMNAWPTIKEDGTAIAGTAGSIKESFKKIANDPKAVLMGFAKLGAVKVFDVATSKLIAEPLAGVMCKRHLVAETTDDLDQAVEDYLKEMGIVPDPTGNYYDSLDFDGSVLFPQGSNLIRICVSYDVKALALLPIDYSFHIKQTAVTHGWLAGETSFAESVKEEKKIVNNETIWTAAGTENRSGYIIDREKTMLKEQGYREVANAGGGQGFDLYNPDSDTFIGIRSSNHLYSAEGERTKTLDDVSETAIANDIKTWTNHMNTTAGAFKNQEKITVKEYKSDGSVVKKDDNCKNADMVLRIVVPEDEGYMEKYQKVLDEIAKDGTVNGVKVEIVKGYGNGAKQTEVKEEKTEEGDKK